MPSQRGGDFSLQSVTGKQLNIYGRLIVWYTVGDDQGLPVPICVTYVVCDARRPTMATASLADRGYRVELGEKKGCIQRSGRCVSLKRIGNTFVLIARPYRNKMCGGMLGRDDRVEEFGGGDIA